MRGACALPAAEGAEAEDELRLIGVPSSSREITGVVNSRDVCAPRKSIPTPQSALEGRALKSAGLCSRDRPPTAEAGRVFLALSGWGQMRHTCGQVIPRKHLPQPPYTFTSGSPWRCGFWGRSEHPLSCPCPFWESANRQRWWWARSPRLQPPLDAQCPTSAGDWQAEADKVRTLRRSQCWAGVLVLAVHPGCPQPGAP